MTEEQIENWRKMLSTQFGLGPYAFIMPKEEIEKIKNNFQGMANDMASELELSVRSYQCEGCGKKFKDLQMQYLERTPDNYIDGVKVLWRGTKAYYQMCPHCEGIFES